MSPQLILFGLIVLVSVIIYLYKCVFKGESFTPIILRNLFPLFRESNKELGQELNNNPELEKELNNNPESQKVEEKTELLNTKKYETNKKVALNQYGQGKIKQSGDYLEMVSKLLNQVSQNKVNINQLNLTEIDYEGETTVLSNFIQYKINDIVKKEEYLQQNSGWKYEYFYPKDIKIYYFEELENKEISNKDNKEIMNNEIPKLKVFKLIYTLYNPLRSVSTDCIAFVTHTNNNDLEIQYTNILNEWKYLQEDLTNSEQSNKNSQSKQNSQNTIFLDSYFEKEFSQSGSSISPSNLKYTDLNCDTVKIDIKADIPEEYKKDIVNIQHLPPSFGADNVKYPPMYKNGDFNTYSYYPAGPLRAD